MAKAMSAIAEILPHGIALDLREIKNGLTLLARQPVCNALLPADKINHVLLNRAFVVTVGGQFERDFG